jgi:hypothetical protein
MPAKAVRGGKVCPFTLELSQSCYFSKYINEQNLCPYSLESCSLLATEVKRTRLKPKTDTSQVPSEVALKRATFHEKRDCNP